MPAARVGGGIYLRLPHFTKRAGMRLFRNKSAPALNKSPPDFHPGPGHFAGREIHTFPVLNILYAAAHAAKCFHCRAIIVCHDRYDIHTPRAYFSFLAAISESYQRERIISAVIRRRINIADSVGYMILYYNIIDAA